MDVNAPQVALSTVIGELSLNNDEEFGVDYFLQFKKNNLGHRQYRRQRGALDNLESIPTTPDYRSGESDQLRLILGNPPAGATVYYACWQFPLGDCQCARIRPDVSG